MNNINLMLIGAVTLSCCMTGLLFLRSWRMTRDRFFLFFALSFFLQGVSTLLMGISYEPAGDRAPFVYLIRLFAFIVILAAIADKNGTKSRDKGGRPGA